MDTKGKTYTQELHLNSALKAITKNFMLRSRLHWQPMNRGQLWSNVVPVLCLCSNTGCGLLNHLQTDITQTLHLGKSLMN